MCKPNNPLTPKLSLVMITIIAIGSKLGHRMTVCVVCINTQPLLPGVNHEGTGINDLPTQVINATNELNNVDQDHRGTWVWHNQKTAYELLSTQTSEGYNCVWDTVTPTDHLVPVSWDKMDR